MTLQPSVDVGALPVTIHNQVMKVGLKFAMGIDVEALIKKDPLD